MSFLSFEEFSYLPTEDWILWTKISTCMFFDVAQIQLICLTHILISGFIALQRALVMMQVSDSCLLVSVRIVLCIFTLELQSESSGIMFDVSGYFCSVGFGVYKLLIYKLLSTS